MESNLLIRSEKESDFEKIYEINHVAFGREAEANLVDQLRKEGAFTAEMSLVAILENEIIGHVLFTNLQISDSLTEVQAAALAPVAVIPSLQKRGIGSQLIKEGVQRLTGLSYQLIIVLGDIDYYPKFGFDIELAKNIECVYSGDHLMALELEKNILSKTGKIKATYANAFSLLD